MIKFKDKLPSNSVFKGVYLITNTIENKSYIGCSINVFRRISAHKSLLRANKSSNKNLQKSFVKYGEEAFIFKYKKINESIKKLNYFEERFIALYNCYNIAKEPTKGGSPNKGRKLSEEWKINLHKNKVYTHSKEVLDKVVKNNKKSACKLKFSKNKHRLAFNSWVEASNHFNVSTTALINSYNRNKKWRDWKIDKKTLQRKEVLLYAEGKVIELKSASACDKYLDMWKGATSHFLNRDGNINGYKVEYK